MPIGLGYGDFISRFLNPPKQLFMPRYVFKCLIGPLDLNKILIVIFQRMQNIHRK